MPFHVHEYNVVACCDAQCQINGRPGVWQPAWDDVLLLFVAQAQGETMRTDYEAAACRPGCGSATMQMIMLNNVHADVTVYHMITFTPMFLPESSVPKWVL